MIPARPGLDETGDAEPARLPVVARAVAGADGVLDDLLPRAGGGKFGLGGEAADDGHFGDACGGGGGEGAG